jgi:hypothetical protein
MEMQQGWMGRGALKIIALIWTRTPKNGILNYSQYPGLTLDQEVSRDIIIFQVILKSLVRFARRGDTDLFVLRE